MDILRDKDGISNIRLIILVFVVLTGIVAALLYFPPIPTRTGEVRTKGDITFLDGIGNPLSGTIEISGAGISGGQNANVNYVSWTNVPNARIYYNVLDTKSIAVNLRISGDSPKGRVVLENYGISMPGSVNVSAPGNPVKYVEISATGVSLAEAEVSVQYTDAEVAGLNESSLVLYRYDSVKQEWSELPTKIDTNNNIASVVVNSLSIFALSTQIPEKIEVRDTKNMPVVSDIKTYDEAKNVKKAERNSVLSTADIPQSGELEVDALATKNVAVKLKVNVPSRGEVILDDFGKNNPESVPLPGRVVKFVEIGASGISFSSADITIRYTDADLNGGSEDALTIYHWNGKSWDAMPTSVDKVNKTLSTTTTSFTTWGVGTPYRYFLGCNAGTYLNSTTGGAYSTNFTCVATGDVPMMIGLLNDTSAGAGVSSRLRIGTAAIGQWDYARIINKTAFSTDVNVTGLNGSISMYAATAGTAVGGWYEMGYYNPNGTANNFVGLFNSTVATTTSATQTSFAISFNNQWGIIPAGNKSAVRVWMNATVSNRPGFWSYGTAANQDSSINVTIATPIVGGNPPNITSWGNNKTNNQNLTFTLNTSEFINFNATANQTITTWRWFEDDINQSWNYNNITTNFSSGIHTIKVNGTNTNGTSNTITWTVTVYAPPNITSWGNTKTNNASLNLTINTSEVVQFNATANQTVTWRWYKDDTLQPSNTTNTFNTSWSAAGSYHIDVNATNANGTSNSIRWNITVTAPPGNPPNITSWGNNKTNNLSLSVTINRTELIKFNATANQTITTWNWYKDNVLQTSNTTASFNTSWDTTGNYHIDLNATNSNGTSGTITWNIIVTGPPPPNITSWGNNKTNNASLTFTVNTSEVIKFNATANQTITTWNWYKDNVVQSNNFDNFTTNWGTAGSYHIDLNATNANGTSSTITWLLTVTTPPGAGNPPSITSWGNNVTSDSSTSISIGTNVPVKFNATANQTITTWNWYKDNVLQSNNFDNFTTSWSAGGSYHIDVNAANANGTSSTVTWYVTVTSQPKIMVATNRYVILDDPGIGTAGPNFSNPGYDYTSAGWNYWSGKNTRINATVLYIDNNGFPVNGINITFTLYNPGGGVNATNYSKTNAIGLANVSFDLNGTEYYGKWQVKAGNGTLNDSTTFIYNWWGCATSDSVCQNSATHFGASPNDVTAVTANSPYLNGKDTVTSKDTRHQSGGSTSCTRCHQSYDGSPGGNTLTVNHSNNPSDVHRNITCDNANCHGSYTTHNTNQLVYSCYNSGCHGNGSSWDRKDLSNKSTLNSANVATALSEYSINSTDFNATFHNPNSTIPCIICHGPMHNITKPDESLRFTRNNNTEDSQCKTCHSSYNEHNSSNTTSGGVNCTLCHSDDVHDIQVFAQNATYVDLNHDNPNQARGNCTNCHQNATFFGILENTTRNPKAGNYTGRDPPIIPAPLNHSTDPMSGALWNGSQARYWDNTSQKSACYYCHGNTTHSTSALGSIGNVRGTNNLNQDLTTSRWCANCHYASAPNYGGNQFSLQPPEVLNQSGLVPAKSRDGTTFTNHSSYFSSGYNDSVCKNCHNNNLAASATSLNFSHNVNIGSGGAPNCIQCHNLVTGLSGGAPVGVNFTAANLSVHNGTNSQNATNWSYAPVIGACWACHDTDGNLSTGHPDMYKTPKTCEDCHLANSTYYNQSVKWGLNVTVSEHYYGGDQIRAGNSSSNISSCINCHENVSEMIIYNNDTDYGSFVGDGVRLTGGNMSFYHYGANRSDLRSWDSNRSENCSYCHQNTNTAFSVAMADPNWNASIANHSTNYNATNPGCTNSSCHNSGWIHNSTLTKPVSNDTFCKNCHGVGGTAAKNNKTEHKRLYCTECHANSTNATLAGRDIHPIKYLNQSNGFNTSNSSVVDCTTCHQNTSVDSSLTFTPPKIPNPLRHSDNVSNGSVWNGTQARYWVNTSPLTACIYCHNNTLHNLTPLGRILQWSPNYQINLSIGSNYSCSDCHYKGDSNYSLMNSTFVSTGLSVPPEITNGTNWKGNANYYNHSLINYTDAACKLCHGLRLNASANMSEFMHNVTNNMTGICTDCHYSFPTMNTTTRPDRYVNSTLYSASPHGSVSCENCHTKGHRNIGARKACEDCHAVVKQVPIQDADRGDNRHNITRTPSTYMYSGTSVVNITTCTICHDPGLYSNATSTYGYYGYGKTYDCDYCHTYPDKTYS